MRIVFIGCVESSKILLEQLLLMKANVVGVITRKSSKLNSDFVDLNLICKNQNIKYKYTENINDVQTVQFITELEPDVIYCFGFSQLLKKEIIDIPLKGVIGFHPAALPANRGRHPLIWALVLGLQETASTFFIIEAEADNGSIVSQEKIKISETETARTLYNKVMEIAKKQIVKLTKEFEEDHIIKIPQDNKKSNVWRKRSKKDGEIDWRMSSRMIFNLIRALSEPYVGAHFLLNGQEYKVWDSEIVYIDNIQNIEYGKILKVLDNNSFIVKTGDGAILLKNVFPDIILHENVYLD